MKRFPFAPGPGRSRLWCIILFALADIIGGFAAEPVAPALPATGVNLAREGGGWLNVSVQSDRFVISFFNDQKEPVPANVQHGLVRYSPVSLESQRTPLDLSADGKTMISPINVRAPHAFRVNLALYNDGPGDAAETYAFFYRG